MPRSRQIASTTSARCACLLRKKFEHFSAESFPARELNRVYLQQSGCGSASRQQFLDVDKPIVLSRIFAAKGKTRVPGFDGLFAFARSRHPIEINDLAAWRHDIAPHAVPQTEDVEDSSRPSGETSFDFSLARINRNSSSLWASSPSAMGSTRRRRRRIQLLAA